jgi:hypothetical protein
MDMIVAGIHKTMIRLFINKSIYRFSVIAILRRLVICYIPDAANDADKKINSQRT